MNQLKINPQSRTDMLLLIAFCGFLLFYGLGAFGLVGADEPRYAQIGREMLARGDWITPTLLGKPWLEKPVLYYWQAMIVFRVQGVGDGAARLPSALDAAVLVAAIFFFLRRFRPGSELDGALITASSAAVIGFAHAAATDMPLAACFSIGLLAWYAWYETRHEAYLAAFYVFVALGTLAKGPVAPALSAVIVFLFVAAKRDWRAILATLWLPGIILYLAMALPWYVAVQLRNPGFFRLFILEHNLSRFSRDVYHHQQPFWFYVPVFLLALAPWTIILIAAVAERIRLLASEGKEAFSNNDDSWSLFLLIWMLVPVFFFSASQSKLPGYILPAVPAASLLVAEYLAVRRLEKLKLSASLAVAHGAFCGLLLFVALSAASLAASHRLHWTSASFRALAESALVAVAIVAALMSRTGLRLITRATAFTVVICVFLIVRFAAPVIDATQSARPVAERIEAFSHEPVPLAEFRATRQQEYGLEFYLDRAVSRYEDGNVPLEAHLVVAAQNSQTAVAQLVPGRRVSYLTSIPPQKLDLYWVGK